MGVLLSPFFLKGEMIGYLNQFSLIEILGLDKRLFQCHTSPPGTP